MKLPKFLPFTVVTEAIRILESQGWEASKYDCFLFSHPKKDPFHCARLRTNGKAKTTEIYWVN